MSGYQSFGKTVGAEMLQAVKCRNVETVCFSWTGERENSYYDHYGTLVPIYAHLINCCLDVGTMYTYALVICMTNTYIHIPPRFVDETKT